MGTLEHARTAVLDAVENSVAEGRWVKVEVV